MFRHTAWAVGSYRSSPIAARQKVSSTRWVTLYEGHRHTIIRHSFTCTSGTGLTIPAGTEVHIPINGFHSDESIFPDPDQFDPERFSREAAAKRHPLAFMPFSHGPRNCIGVTFALLLAKGIIH